MKVAIATCTKLPEVDVDQEPLLAALAAAGVTARMLAWDDESAKAEPDELVVIRSTWNYYARVDDFLAWLDRTAAVTRIYNPPGLVRPNARKTYLAELAKSGIDIVPTAFVLQAAQGARGSVAEIVAEQGWEGAPLVLKPVVSAGSFLTQRFAADDLDGAQRFLDQMTVARDAMIQPWMPSVDTYGERALVWIDGELTHAVRKSPRFLDASEAVSKTAAAIAPEESDFAKKVLRTVTSTGEKDLLYARIDIVKDEASGVLRLMELELIEPSLFLTQSPPAMARLVQAIVARAGSKA